MLNKTPYKSKCCNASVKADSSGSWKTFICSKCRSANCLTTADMLKEAQKK